jgi:hypothetical protein
MHDHLKAGLKERVRKALEVRDNTAMHRHAAYDLPEFEVAVCLGDGRCLFSDQHKETRTCAFCLKYPAGPASALQADAIMDRFIKGN